jgi:hypothetical protein
MARHSNIFAGICTSVLTDQDILEYTACCRMAALRLNRAPEKSKKTNHAPEDARPLKNLAMAM